MTNSNRTDRLMRTEGMLAGVCEGLGHRVSVADHLSQGEQKPGGPDQAEPTDHGQRCQKRRHPGKVPEITARSPTHGGKSPSLLR